MHDLTGSEKYSIDLNSGSFDNALLQFKQFESEDFVVYTAGIT
jgi:hypothetical protein